MRQIAATQWRNLEIDLDERPRPRRVCDMPIALVPAGGAGDLF